MATRRPRRTERSQPVLPLGSDHVPNSISCWYCDWKIRSFNQILFSIGQRYSRVLQIWFTIGAAFSFAALTSVTMLLIWDFTGVFHLHSGTYGLSSLSVSWLFSTSPLAAFSYLSILKSVMLIFSTLLSVAIHEFGHAIAAASEGIEIEYIAMFLALIFPGALVALNYDMLQSLQRLAALRIYSAGIWHNIMLCAACGIMLLLLPLILCPLYIHGEMPVVLGMPQTSPLNGYLSHGDAIMSVDGSKVHDAREWTKKMIQISSQNLSKDISERKGYCVPNTWLYLSENTQLVGGNFSCPDEQANFVDVPCLNLSLSTGVSNESTNKIKRETESCLMAKDVVKLKKCGDGWKISAINRTTCACLEEETCMEPVPIPGTSWVEISYSSPNLSECLELKKNISKNSEVSDQGSSACSGTFVFVGDALSLAYSVYLSSYLPRWAYVSASMPNFLEIMLSCTLNVSATLAVLNSLPVFLLDGEYILEMGLHYVTWLNPRRRRKVLRLCLIGGSILSVIVLAKILYSTFHLPSSY